MSWHGSKAMAKTKETVLKIIVIYWNKYDKVWCLHGRQKGQKSKDKTNTGKANRPSHK